MERSAYATNLVTAGNDKSFFVELSNSTQTNKEGSPAPDADLTITMGRDHLGTVMAGYEAFDCAWRVDGQSWKTTAFLTRR